MSKFVTRLEKLEKANVDNHPPVILCYGGEGAKAEAVAEWEAKNGPIGDREPMYVIFEYV